MSFDEMESPGKEDWEIITSDITKNIPSSLFPAFTQFSCSDLQTQHLVGFA